MSNQKLKAMEKETMKQFIEDLKIEIAESLHEQKTLSRRITAEFENINKTMNADVDVIKKIEWLETSVQNLIRYKNQYQIEQQHIEWNQNLCTKMEGGTNE